MAEFCYAAYLISQDCERVFRDHRDAFGLPDEQFVSRYRLTKGAAGWLCSELRSYLVGSRETCHTLTVEQKVLCALRFYAAGGFQGTVASDEHLAISQSTVSRVLHAVTNAIVERLSLSWLRFPQTEGEKAAAKAGFFRIAGIRDVIGKCTLRILERLPNDGSTMSRAT